MLERHKKHVKLFTAFVLLTGFSAVLLLVSPKTDAAINQQINFQGKLTNTDGTNVANGNYSIRFRIYTDPTLDSSNPCAANTCKWEDTETITVTDGIFNYALGSNGSYPLPGSVDFTQAGLYLGLKVGSDLEMTPRVQLTAAPYAFNSLNSEKLGNIASTGFVQLGQVSGAAGQTDNSTNSSLFVNKTNTGNIVQLQSGAVDVLTVSNTGDLAFGQNANHTISVAQESTDADGNSLTISAGQGGAGASVNDGGVLALQGGAGGGTNGNGGNLTLAGGVANGTGTAGSVIVKNPTNSVSAFQVQDASGATVLNVDTTNKQVAISGGVTVNVADASIVRSSNADFALGTIGADLENSTSPSGQLELSDGTVPNSGMGTITTAGQPTTSAAIGAGALAITRPDGKYLVVRGGGTGLNIYDSFAGTFTNSAQVLVGNAGAGALALPRADGRYRIIHGGGLTTSSLVDPMGVQAVGGSVAINASNAGTVAFKRADGQFLVMNGGAATGSMYNPVADTFTTVAPAPVAATGAGSLVLVRPDGQALIVNGGATSTTQLYNPNNGTTGAFVASVSLDGNQAAGTCGINGLGSVALRRADGVFVILSKAGVSALYDPVAGTIVCRNANGPASALGNGAHAIPLQNGKFLVIRGGATTTSFIYDPTADTFTTHGTALSTITTGSFSIMRQDGSWQILAGGSTTTNNYNTGLVMSGTSTKYTSDDIQTSSLNSTSRLNWTAQLESVYTSIANAATNTAFSTMQFYVRTATLSTTCTAALNTATDREIQSSGDFIQPAPTDNCIRISVQFNRPLPKRIVDERFTWTGNSSTVNRLDYITPTLFDVSVDNSVAIHKDAASFNLPDTQANNAAVPAALTAGAPSAGGSCTAGLHGWYVSFVTNGTESVLSAKSGTQTCSAGNGTVALTAIPLGPTGTTARKVYRSYAGDTSAPYLLTTINDNVTTSFNDTVADGSLGAVYAGVETSGPVATRSEAVNGALSLPNGRVPGPTIIGTTGFYTGQVSAAHQVLPQVTSEGTIVIARPNRTFIVIPANGASNANLYDPATQTFTSQAGTGVPTVTNATTGGGFAVKRSDGKFLVVFGGSASTNIYDPDANVFTTGPSLTAAAGIGASPLINTDGTITIVHGGGVLTSSLYDPVRNQMTVGPATTTATNCGFWAVPLTNGLYKTWAGIGAGVTGVATGSMLYDPSAKKFTATANLASAGGCGSYAFQRPDGFWFVVAGASGTTGANATNTMLMNPYNGSTAAGVALTNAAGRGGHVIPRADGTFMVVSGGATATTTVYDPTGGTMTTIGAPQGVMVGTGPAPSTVGAGGLSFQRPDGKWVIITGNATTTVNTYDAGWWSDGQYLSEQMQVPALSANSTLNWAQNNDNFVRMEVRAASSQAALATTGFTTIGRPGQSMGNAGGETWVQVEINFRRDFPTFGGSLNGVYSSGGGMVYASRKMSVPSVSSYSINNGSDLLTLQNNGLNVFRVTSQGSVYTSPNGGFYSGGADLAENYTSTDSLQPGEVVATDAADGHGVKRSSSQYQPSILGVVSTAPGFVAGAYTEDSYPIALVGRVPVKISTENGAIHEGDYLTSASIAGYAMKASISGRVLGTALESFDPEDATTCPTEAAGNLESTLCGTVMMFVNLTDYQGESVESLMAADGAGQLTGNAIIPEVDFPDVDGLVGTKQMNILSFLQDLKSRQVSGQAPKGGEILTNRVSAVDEVISPVIVADIIRAKTIQATKIEGLEVYTDKVSSLSLKYDGLKTQVTQTGTATNPSTTANNVTFGGPGSNVSLIALGLIEAKGGLTVNGESQFNGKTTFAALAQFMGKVNFSGDITVDGRVTFNNDTAGAAVIAKGGTRVQVKFDSEYADDPIVSAQLIAVPAVLANGTKEDATQAEQRLFSAGYNYVVSDVSTKGFTIVLNKKAAEKLKFNWQAIAINGARTVTGDVDPDASAGGGTESNE
ncbi:hypothetical protein JNM87_01815 [Candidatus Saccharibacteria bacterium]|nr:hypothetical protein [Candidatus Saccharibacteria bacterium]